MRFDRTLVALAVIVIGGGLIGLWRGQPAGESGAGEASMTPRSVLTGGDAASGYARVTGPRPFQFPADHGAHPAYRSEWWYVTGNVEAANGRHYGFQITFFRFALSPQPVVLDSDWATRQAWLVHFAVTDSTNQRHFDAQRLQRGALGLAGARVQPFKVWVDNWQLRTAAGSDGPFPMWLTADAGEFAVELRLTRRKGRVLQGQSGYSPKSEAAGNASYYYSYPRLGVRGDLRVGDTTQAVTGTAWLDREWGTSALAADQVGWDWFALQLDDGRDVMLYRIRGADGATDPASAGLVVAADGDTWALSPADFQLTPRRRWRSSRGVAYPVTWRVQVPSADIDAVVAARVDDQLMNLDLRYWEGAVTVRPSRSGTSPRGVGYLEMTGYRRSAGAAP